MSLSQPPTTCLFYIIATFASAQAAWETTKISPGELSNQTCQGEQDSHVVSNGELHLAFVVSENNQEALYYTTRIIHLDESEQPTQTVQLIDTGRRIRSLQIKHDESNGNTHFAYSKQLTTTPNGGNASFISEKLTHVNFNPNNTPQTEKTTIVSRSPFAVPPYEISLALPHLITDKAHKMPAVAYHIPDEGGLRYAEKHTDSNDWNTSGIQAGPGLGRGCRLHYDLLGNPNRFLSDS